MNHFSTIIPPIKCQGIKSKLVPWLHGVIPGDFEGTWIEPFVGSGVVAFNVRPKRAILADTNPHLVNFYQALSRGAITPVLVRAFLESEGARLLESGGRHYYEVRDRFNEKGDPMDFLFLNRSCFNGLIRFNKSGEFNVPFCRKPERFSRALVTKIVNQVRSVRDVIGSGDYTFLVQHFAQTISAAGKDDMMYCDPPYIGRHTDYFNGWDDACEKELGEMLAEAPCRFILSTWHHNDYRKNAYIDSLWSRYHILTREHFYHVGASEDNRNPMIEALVANFRMKIRERPPAPEARQLLLLEEGARELAET